MLTIYQCGWEGEWLIFWWFRQVLWQIEVLGDLYRANAESDLTKAQNSSVNNELIATAHIN